MEIEKRYSFLEICKWSGLFLLFAGTVARISLYIYCKDMWLDEACLAESIWAGDIWSILNGKLLNGQSAPLGFLVLTKLISYFGGTSEYVLRFLPLVSGIASGFLLWAFARREVDEVYALICTLLFVGCIPLLYYVTEFKQYATEALVTIIYLYIYTKSLDSLSKNTIPLSTVLISCICLLFSLPGLFVFCGMALSALIMALIRGEFYIFIKNNMYKILFILIFVSIHVLYLWKTINQGMFIYWEKYFFPINPTELPEYIKTTLAPIFNLSMEITRSDFNIVMLACSFFSGLFFMYKKHFHLFLLVFTTWVFFISASAMKIYPLGHSGIIGSRLSLFYFPLIFVSVSYLFYRIYDIVCTKNGFIILILIVSCSLFTNQYKFVRYGGTQLQQISGLIKTMNDTIDNVSEIIVYNSSNPAYRYYQHRNNKDFIYSVISSEKDPAVELQRVVSAGRGKGKTTYYALFSHYDDQYYERCIAYIQSTYHLDKIIKAPGARLVVFRM